MPTITINTKPEYPLIIEANAINQVKCYLAKTKPAHRYVIIADKTISKTYATNLLNILSDRKSVV